MKNIFVTFALVSATVSLFGDLSHPFHRGRIWPIHNNCPETLEADVIVVGGGAAGCILMNRLSENGRFSVLGIEAGANLTGDPAIQAVGLPAFLLPGTAGYKYFWWGWKQVKPNPALNGRITSDWITGFTLGGGSSVNGLYYGRGSNTMYSRWKKVSDSDNWSLDKILKTFKSLENYQGLTITPGARGDKGPVNVLQTPIPSPLALKILNASINAFPLIPVVEDYNDPSVENCIDPRAQWLIDPNGNRVSSATAFLNDDVMTPDGFGVNGHDLRVIFESVAVKIEFNEEGCAKKVKYLKDGQLFEACARKAVVLAGGINSSKLLQLSGIGPKKTLKKAGIEPVFINENVGKHLQNHPLLVILMEADPNDIGILPGEQYAFTIESVYLPKVGDSPSDPRMLQILFEYFPGTTPLLGIGFELLNPKSEGSVKIQSDNSFQIAAVNDGFYQDPVDMKHMVKAIQVYIQALLIELGKISTNPFYYKPILIDPINLVLINSFSKDSVEDYIRNNTNVVGDGRHFASHCKMAPLDKGGVVDGDTRVYGTTNCFVTDCSICPVIPDMNTTGPAMMIGLRSSEILKRILRD